MWGSPVAIAFAAQQAPMSVSLVWMGSMLAMRPSFSWEAPWYAPVIFLRAWYSSLRNVLKFPGRCSQSSAPK